MHKSIINLIEIKKEINSKYPNSKFDPEIIAVSKTFPIEHISPLIEHGHSNFGENKVQEAIDKWTELKKKSPKLNLHMIGKLQTNKVKFAVKLFDYIHSVDTEKLARKISDEGTKINKKIKIFIQVNIANEAQKSGINKNELSNLISLCKSINLDLIGLMCIPPENEDPTNYFKEMDELNKSFALPELSMGMSGDYLKAVHNSSTFIRIGSSIFGNRF